LLGHGSLHVKCHCVQMAFYPELILVGSWLHEIGCPQNPLL
jgi:hypothetical protein